MKQWSVTGVVISLILAFCLSTSVHATVTVTPQPPDLPEAQVIVTGYQVDATGLNFVQIYNDSNDMILLDGWQVEYVAASQYVEQATLIELNGYILPDSYVVLAASNLISGADSYLQLPSLEPGFSSLSLALQPPAEFLAADPIPLDTSIDGQRYYFTKSGSGNYINASEFEAANEGQSLEGGGLYAPADSTPLRVVALMANARDCGPLDKQLDCSEFIKLYNASLQTVQLDDYRLRFGHGNDRSGIANTVPLKGELAADSYLVVNQRSDGEPLSITASHGHVWLEDAYGFTAYQPTVVQYRDIGAADYKGYAWGFDGQTWRWAVPSLAANDFTVPDMTAAQTSGLKPCDDNQYRNPETNRCRLIASQTSNLKPCGSHQYRSPETNRCRNLASSDSLKPCDADQRRNPETNRCRSIQGASSELKPCRADQYRHSETNRCRKLQATDPPEAAFAAQPVSQAGSSFIGWWVLGGVGSLAIGYAVYEWRTELLGLIRKVGSFFGLSK